MCTKEGLACLFLLLLLHNRRHAGKPNLFRPILLLSPRLRTDDDEVHLLDRPPPPTALNGRAKTLKKGEKLFQAASFLIPAARLLFLRLIPSPSPAPFQNCWPLILSRTIHGVCPPPFSSPPLSSPFSSPREWIPTDSRLGREKGKRRRLREILDGGKIEEKPGETPEQQFFMGGGGDRDR